MWMSLTLWCNKLILFYVIIRALCDDVHLCNRCVREFWSWHVHSSHSVCLLKPGVTLARGTSKSEPSPPDAVPSPAERGLGGRKSLTVNLAPGRWCLNKSPPILQDPLTRKQSPPCAQPTELNATRSPFSGCINIGPHPPLFLIPGPPLKQLDFSPWHHAKNYDSYS
jgi:hypothetical protein